MTRGTLLEQERMKVQETLEEELIKERTSLGNRCFYTMNREARMKNELLQEILRSRSRHTRMLWASLWVFNHLQQRTWIIAFYCGLGISTVLGFLCGIIYFLYRHP